MKTNIRTKQHRSDGRELVPAEIQAGFRRDKFEEPSQAEGEISTAKGYTRDDEGLINSYSIEPKMSASEYPSAQLQKRYIFLAMGSALFVSILVWIAFSIS